MPFRRMWFVLLLGWMFCEMPALPAADAPDRSADETAIRQRATEYLAALAKQDAKVFEDFWLADGDVIDPWGHAYPASEAVGQKTTANTEIAQPEIRLLGTKIRFLSNDVALEDGVSEVQFADRKQSPVRGRFTAVWTKRDGQWWLASLRESSPPPPSPQTQLAALDSLVGNWVGQRGDKTVEISARWSENHAFLLRGIHVLSEGKAVFSASQRIGWDPQTRTIKSWTFDADGGHSEGTWVHDGTAWSVDARGVLPDGRATHSINAFIPEGKDRLLWKSYGSHGANAGGSSDNAADIEVTLERKTAD